MPVTGKFSGNFAGLITQEAGITVRLWSSDHSATTHEFSMIAWSLSSSLLYFSSNGVSAVKARAISNVKVWPAVHSLGYGYGVYKCVRTAAMSSNFSDSDPPLSKKSRGPYRQTMKPSRQTRYNWRKRVERQVVASGNEPSNVC